MRTITISTPGPQGPVGPQGIQGPSGSVDTSFLATTGSNTFVGNQIINGNVTVSGTASINTLVVNQTSLSTGSNQFGDAANDTQTLYGTVRITTGSLAVTGSVLVATAMSDANNAPLVAQNLTAYSSPFTQYIQIWKNSAGTILSSLRADGFFDISTGGITAPSITARANGSAAAPVFSRSNNITTGIFFPTTNNIAISTNSTEALRVFSTQNVSIGTTTDSGYKLDVSGSGNYNNNLTVTGSLTMGGSIYTSGQIGYANNSRYLQFNDVDSLVRLQGFNGIRLMTYDTTGYTDVIKIDGNVATRTVQVTGSLAVSRSIAINTSPSNFNLDTTISTNGGIRFNGALGGNLSYTYAEYIGAYYVAGWNSTGNIGLRSGASQRILISNTDQTAGLTLFGNRLGLANTTPSAKLHITGEGSGSATTALRVDDSNGSASLFVRDDGRVGVGTTSPGAALEVNGSVKATTLYTANWSYDAASNTKGITTQGAVAGDKLTLTDSNGYTGTSNQNLFVIGNTGFNPSSGTGTFNIINLIASISQSGTATGITRGIYVNPTVTSAANYRAIETTSGSVIFNHGTTSLMFISSSGFVGINTTTDAGYKLDVNGTARVSGAFSAQGPNSSFIESNNALYGMRVEYNGGRLYINSSEAAINGRPFYVGQANANSSAIMQADSTTKGFLPPRMTNAQRTAISSPAVGLMVYCTDATEGLYIYKSTGWTFII